MMEINTYTDYIVERLEILSIITILATGLLYLKFGFLAACIPSAVFHLGAYLGYKKFKRNANENCTAN